MEWTAYFPVKHLVLHTGRMPSINPKAREAVKSIIYKSLEILELKAEKWNVEILLENTGLDKHDFDSDMNEFKNTIEYFNLGVCLDTGHANIALGTECAIKELGSNVKELHVHDNFGKSDQHLPVGEGNINWQAYKKLICSGNIPVVHEIIGHKTPAEATLKSRQNLIEIL